MPELQFCEDVEAIDHTVTIITTINPITSTRNCVGTKIFFIIDAICIGWFTLEVILRLTVCPSFKQYFTSPLNIIDILAILPFYFELLVMDYIQWEFHKVRAVLMFLRMLRVVRIFRILKLARYLSSLRVLGCTLKAAVKELNMLFLFIMLATFIFANFLYQLEKDLEDTSFSSIPASFW